MPRLLASVLQYASPVFTSWERGGLECVTMKIDPASIGDDPTLTRRERQRGTLSRGLRKTQSLRRRAAPQDTTPADLRTVILVIGGFLLALFFVTKLALGL